MQVRAPLLLLLPFLMLGALLLGIPLAGGLLLLVIEGLTPANLALLLPQPGLWHSAGLSLWVAGASTLGALGATALLLAQGDGRPWMRWLRRLLSPLLALPHVAFAIGIAFLIAPSGWLLRLVAPLLDLTHQPPDWQTLKDPWGLGLIVVLILKETPFLLLMALAALDPAKVARQQWLGASLGFSGPRVWGHLLLPPLYFLLVMLEPPLCPLRASHALNPARRRWPPRSHGPLRPVCTCYGC